jgi:asparagine synthetase A
MFIELPSAFYWDGRVEALNVEDIRADEFPISDTATVVCEGCDWTGIVGDMNRPPTVKRTVTIHYSITRDCKATIDLDLPPDCILPSELVKLVDDGDVDWWQEVQEQQASTELDSKIEHTQLLNVYLHVGKPGEK